MRLPIPEHSQAVLIGAPTFHSQELRDLPGVSNNLKDLYAVLTDPVLCGLHEQNSHLVANPRLPDVGITIEAAARKAEDTLIVYYAGHGIPLEGGELYLAVETTDPAYVTYTALPFALVGRAVNSSAARNRILIIDCCFSGRAVEAMTDPSSLIAGETEIFGAYTMTSTGRNTTAVAPPGARNTAFTGAILDLIRTGIPNGPEMLSLGNIYRSVRRQLITKSLPEPQQRGTGLADQLAIARNVAITTSLSDASAAERTEIRTSDATTPTPVSLTRTPEPHRSPILARIAPKFIEARKAVTLGDVVYEHTEVGGTRGIFIRYKDGTVAKLSSNGHLNDTQPDTSITSRIAFIRRSAIWAMDPDGSEQTELFDFASLGAEYWVATPRWSPNGKRLTFELRRGAKAYEFQSEDPQWPEDIEALVGRMRSAGESNLYRINGDGSGLMQLTTDNVSYGPATWSPRGNRLIFSRDIGRRSSWRTLYLMNAAGGEVVPLSDQEYPDDVDQSYPEWAPNGKIYYRALQREIGAWSIAPRYYTFPARQSYGLPSWSPDFTDFSSLRVSVDGTRMVFGCEKIYSREVHSGLAFPLIEGSTLRPGLRPEGVAPPGQHNTAIRHS